MSVEPNHDARVLVVDDSRLLRELAQEALREICQVDGCGSSANFSATRDFLAAMRTPSDWSILAVGRST